MAQYTRDTPCNIPASQCVNIHVAHNTDDVLAFYATVGTNLWFTFHVYMLKWASFWFIISTTALALCSFKHPTHYFYSPRRNHSDNLQQVDVINTNAELKNSSLWYECFQQKKMHKNISIKAARCYTYDIQMIQWLDCVMKTA